jgi:hypothetical protein
MKGSNGHFRNFCLAICISLGLAPAGCVTVPAVKKPAPTVIAERQLPRRVAVLPFVNRTPNPEAAEILRKMFYNFFGSLNYLDQEPSLVDEKLRQHQLYEQISTGNQPSLLKLGQLLGVDAVVLGEVTSLGKIYALVYADNQAGLKTRLVKCASGEVVWEMEHTVHQREGDVPLSLTGLAATLIKTAISHQQATHVQAAAELCMQMVTTIPNPPAVTEPPPKIRVMVHNGAGKLLRPNDQLKLVMVGDRGLKASWSLPPLKTRAPLEEIEPGVYAGAYRIEASDMLPHGRIVGHLTSKTGIDSQWIDTLGQVKIGAPTELPAVVAKNTVLTAARSPYLVRKALVVLPNATLTIAPGAVIWFEKLGLIVKGELHVLGDQQAPVALGGLGATPWKGIFFDHSAGKNVLQHCSISGAQYGLRAIASDLSMTHSRFWDNGWGMVIESGRADVRRCLFRTSAKSGIAAKKAELTLTESIVTENRAGGVLLEDSQATISANNIANNGNWQLKVLDLKGKISTTGNWWGRKKPGDIEIVGKVRLGRALDKPLDFSVRPSSP